jgi:quinol monooxygenase YgiN
MPPFAQHTKLVAAPGKRDELVAKFLEAVEIQRDNPACEIMLVSSGPGGSDNVYLTEVWSSREAWERATQSEEIAAWAASMPSLANGGPETVVLELRGGKGVTSPTSR